MNLTERAALVLQEIDAALALAEKATPGPWSFAGRGYRANTVTVPDQPNRKRPDFDAWINLNYDGGFADGTFIATSRTLLPDSLRMNKTALERLIPFCGGDTWAADIVTDLCDTWQTIH